MRFRELELYQVGRHNGLVLTGLLDGLNVVYGPNEAGKSTALAALRAMLFGRMRGTEPDVELQRGASGLMRAESEAGQTAVLERSLVRKSPVKVFGEGIESAVGDEQLHRVFPELRDLEEGIYQSVFTFQLAELNDLSEHRDRLAEKLYTVGLVGKTSPMQLEASFRDAAKSIYNPDRRARTPELTQCLNRLRDLKREKAASEDDVEHYLEFKRRAEELQRAAHKQVELVRAKQRARGNLQKLQELLPWFQKKETKRIELDSFADLPTIEPHMLKQIYQLQEQRRQLLAAQTDLQRAVQTTAAELNQIDVDDGLMQALPGLRKCQEQSTRMDMLLQSLSEIEQERRHLEDRNEQLLATLSGRWQPSEIEGLKLDTQLQTDAKNLQVQWQELDSQRRSLKRQLAQHDLTTAEGAELVRKHSSLNSQEFNQRLLQDPTLEITVQQHAQELANWQQELDTDERKLQRLEDVHAAYERDVRELGILTQAPPDLVAAASDLNPKRVLGVSTILAILWIVGSMWLALSHPSVVGWLLLSASVLLLGWNLRSWRRAAGTWSGRQEGYQNRAGEAKRSAAYLREQCESRVSEFSTVLNSLQRLRGTVKSNLDVPSAADLQGQAVWQRESLSRLRTALVQARRDFENSNADYRQFVNLVRHWREGTRQREMVKRQQQQADRELDKIGHGCAQLQQAVGWGTESQVSPTAWVEEIGTMLEVQENLRVLRKREARQLEYLEDIESWLGELQRALALVSVTRSTADLSVGLSRAGRSVHGNRTNELSAAVRQAQSLLLTKLQEAEANAALQAEQDRLTSDLQQYRNREKAKQKQLAQAEGQLTTLYQRLGAADETEFAHLVEVAQERDTVAAEHRELLLRLYGLCGGEERYRELEQPLTQSSHNQLMEALQTSEREIGEAATEQERLQAELAEVNVRLKQWDTRERETLEWDLAQAVGERRKLAFDWASYRVAEALVRTARERFEAERQPQILQTAGQMFRKLTEERYVGFKSRFDENGQAAIVAVDAAARDWPFTALSRGTREQIYLCLRLALVKDYAERGIRVPLVLDDPMVNFDSERMAPCIQLLADAAKSVQVIYFTCHAAVASRFQELASASVVQMNKLGNEVRS